uniref:Ubiquitin-like domain-containing protein n=1 Tax=Ananas comosus var. bracteatus TaxID=296719 RepID=A0A6V7QD58_ANACO|nr:unnamed protein product [Ananas comosus var. bracteatus]
MFVICMCNLASPAEIAKMGSALSGLSLRRYGDGKMQIFVQSSSYYGNFALEVDGSNTVQDVLGTILPIPQLAARPKPELYFNGHLLKRAKSLAKYGIQDGSILHLNCTDDIDFSANVIRTELKSGIEYWALEKKLCGALTSKTKILIEDAMRAIHLKSFDYRVLNLLLYQLIGQQTNELHMEFLSVSEFLVEVSDDLYDYEAKCICEAEEKYESLSKTLDPDLSLNYWRRCEEATKEGGLNSGHAYGTWTIPCVIADEDSFRAQSVNKKSRGS